MEGISVIPHNTYHKSDKSLQLSIIQSKTAKKEYFQCFHNKEMINV
jgi:hypothetical protein